MPRFKRSAAGMGLALATGLALAACSGGGAQEPPGDFDIGSATWEEIVEQAEAEGEVTVYLALANYEQHLMDGFSEAYPDIKLNIVREPSGSLITKALAEKDAGSAGGDVVFLSDFRFFEDYNAELAEAVGPSADLYADVDESGGENYFTALATPFTLVSNPDVLSDIGADPVNDWEDLLQPELEGLIGITRPDITPIEAQLQHEIYLEHGDDYFEQLAALQPRLGDSSGTLVQSVASGDLAVAIGATSVTTNLLAAEGAPIEDPPATNPSVLVGYAVAALDWSQRPAAAQVLLEWLISEDGQTYQHDWGRTVSVLPDIPNKTGLEVDKIYTGVLTPEEEEFIETTWLNYFG